LDAFKQLLTSTRSSPRQIKAVQDTEVPLQIEASQHGVAAMPGWLVNKYEIRLAILTVRFEHNGITILSEDFLAELQQMERKNLAVVALRKLLNDGIRLRSKLNVVQTK
jgi:hypothetical protein